MNSINKEKTLYTIINSDLQKSNDKVIQNFLSHFKHYEMKEELKNINKEIISEKVLTPDLVYIIKYLIKIIAFMSPITF